MSEGLSSAVAQFLGPAAAGAGPFALLELTPETCTEELVVLQLERQLERLARDTLASTPAGEEIRVALHAAAALLLEACARGPALHARAAPPGPVAMQVAMQRAILATIAHHGGWNRRSIHRLMLLARAHGIAPDDFLGAIRHFARQDVALADPAAPEAPTPGARPSGVPTPDVQPAAAQPAAPSPAEEAEFIREFVDEGPSAGSLIARILLITGGAFVVLAVLALGVGRLLRGPVPSTPAPTPPPTVVERTTEEPRRELFPKESPAVPRDERTAGVDAPEPPAGIDKEPATVVRALGASVAAINSSNAGEASLEFRSLARVWARAWTGASPGEIVAAQDAHIEYLYRTVGMGSSTNQLLDDVLLGAGQPGELSPETIVQSAWYGGLAARLLRERDLSASVSARVQQAVLSPPFRTLPSASPTFAQGSLALLAYHAERLTGVRSTAGDPQAARAVSCWEAWRGCLDALELAEPERDEVVLAALERFLASGPEPSMDRGAAQTMSLLVRGVSWKQDGRARAALLEWLGKVELSAGDLHAVTRELAEHAPGEGFDLSMVLPASAGDYQRLELRERLRSIWGMGASGSGAPSARAWGDLTRGILSRGEGGTGLASRLARALVLARLSEQAAGMWMGEPASAIDPSAEGEAIASRPAGPGEGGFAPSPRVTLDFSTDGGWVARFYAVRNNAAQRRQLLGEYTPGREEHLAAEAAIIAEEAIRGSSQEPRRLAADIVLRNSSHPHFVNALLDLSPLMPATQDNSRLVSGVAVQLLPSVRDPSWRLAVRRALVERLLELASAQGEMVAIDQAARLLADCYAGQAERLRASGVRVARERAGEGLAGAARIEEEAPAAEASAGLIRVKLDGEAQQRLPSGHEALSLAEIRQRRSARLAVASGRVQRFHAEQVNIVELLSYLVSIERPASRERVRHIIESLGHARRGATDISQQIEAGEAAMVRLWMLRLGEELPP